MAQEQFLTYLYLQIDIPMHLLSEGTTNYSGTEGAQLAHLRQHLSVCNLKL